MTVGELKKRLEGVEDTLQVVLQRYVDEERYSLCAGVETAHLVYLSWGPEGDEVKYTRLTTALEEQGFGEEVVAALGVGESCVVLWPRD